MNPLRVLILTPAALPRVSGNAITAERWRRTLSEKDIMVKVMETRGLNFQDLNVALEDFSPDVVHAHHASKAGTLLFDPGVSQRHAEIPFVVSPAGTDINIQALHEEEKIIVCRTLRRADCLISQSRETTRLITEIMPDLTGRIAYVPKSFLWLGTDHFALRDAAGCRPGDILFFMPAGIRPVKGNLECLLALEQAHDADPRIQAVFAGPAIDASYAARFGEEINRLQAFASWIPQIPPTAMLSAYKAADVILNNSASEGLANSLLEAMAAGRPILASDIPANRWLISNMDDGRPNGILFNPGDRQDFIQKVRRLADDPGLRQRLARSACQRAENWSSPADEAHALVRVYEAVVSR